MFDLRVWLDVEADGNTKTSTPGKSKDSDKNQMQRLKKLAKMHRNGQIQKVSQQDCLSFSPLSLDNFQREPIQT